MSGREGDFRLLMLFFYFLFLYIIFDYVIIILMVCSWQEFHAMSLRPEFNEDPGWETLDDQPVYSPEELAAFEKQRKEEIDYLIKSGKVN